MEASLVILSALCAGIVLVRRVGRRAWGLAAICALLVGALWCTHYDDVAAELQALLPAPANHDGYVSSASCRSCHPEAYHSWHDSFHRTMTQPVTPAMMLADCRGADGRGIELHDRGHTTRIAWRGAELWIDTVDPLWLLPDERSANEPPPRIESRIVMATGSHHLQTYWLRRPKFEDDRHSDDGAFFQAPWSWLIAQRRWVPTQDTFLAPPSSRLERSMPWNTSCNMCHSVGTRPRLGPNIIETDSVELGIACEACHGPGEAHIRANESPLRRYRKHFAADDADPTIVNPLKLDKQRSAEVCGQCHSFNKELDMQRWMDTGVAFRPGDELGKTKAVFGYTENPTHPRLLAHLKAEPDALQGRFWKDGTIRVAGREYNGLIESKCYTHGEMTCLSCHAMHDYAEPKDQLSTAKLGDKSCLQCHARFGADIPAHTHHAVGSSGSECMNCHMPHTTYGLLVAMRSHRIDSPNAATAAKTGRPNACNLCHLDRTLAWTAEKLTAWYGHAPAQLTDEQQRLAAAVRWTTNGDAAQRVVAAWAMGWEPARQVSGVKWQAAFLAYLLLDPYTTIRQVAFESLRKAPGFADFEFDFVAREGDIHPRIREAIQRWGRAMAGRPDRYGPHLLLDPEGRLDIDAHERLLQSRDNTPVRIIE